MAAILLSVHEYIKSHLTNAGALSTQNTNISQYICRTVFGETISYGGTLSYYKM